MTQDTSGPAGRLAALDASLCLGFRRNSEEFRNSTELKRHNKRAGKRPARHAIPPSRWKLHCRFYLFPSCRLQLPASCADACLTRPPAPRFLLRRLPASFLLVSDSTSWLPAPSPLRQLITSTKSPLVALTSRKQNSRIDPLKKVQLTLGRAALYGSRGLSSPDERPSSSIESAKKHTEKGGARSRLTEALDPFSRDPPGHNRVASGGCVPTENGTWPKRLPIATFG